MENSQKNDLDSFFKEEEARRNEQFGIKAQINQLLWDCQMEEEYHEEAFDTIIVLMQQIVKSPESVKDLLEIKIN